MSNAVENYVTTAMMTVSPGVSSAQSQKKPQNFVLSGSVNYVRDQKCRHEFETACKLSTCVPQNARPVDISNLIAIYATNELHVKQPINVIKLPQFKAFKSNVKWNLHLKFNTVSTTRFHRVCPPKRI